MTDIERLLEEAQHQDIDGGPWETAVYAALVNLVTALPWSEAQRLGIDEQWTDAVNVKAAYRAAQIRLEWVR